MGVRGQREGRSKWREEGRVGAKGRERDGTKRGKE